MIVQSSDGFFYQNPTFTTNNAIVEFNDDGCILYRKGRVTWRTAVKVLTELGLKARRVDREPEDRIFKVIGDDFYECSVFTLRVIKPIPTPKSYDTRINVPSTAEEDVLWFKVRKS